jgi:tellurite resistance protein TerC
MFGSATSLDWAVFSGVVLASLLLDRLLFGKPKAHISFREASIRSLLFVLAGVGFTAFVFVRQGSNAAITYLTAYLVEESLSVDNLFVFLVLFSYFKVSEYQQQRILTWGIAGAVVMRGIFIAAGTALLNRFHWLTIVFGLVLIFTGLKLAFQKEDSVDPEDNLALKLARKYLRTTNDYQGDDFFVVKDGVRLATPMLVVLIVVEFTDLLFAVDSVPAVLALSNDVYIIYTSNVMAILGLRALYFVISGMMGRFHYLSAGLSIILLFIGGKMVVSMWYKLPSLISLCVIAVVLFGSILLSLLRPKASEEADG